MTGRYPHASLVAVLATAALIGTLLVAPGHAPTALDVYVLSLGAIALVVLVSRARRPQPRSRIDMSAPGPRTGAERIPELERIERLIVLASGSAFDLHYRLRPLLRELTGARLATQGIDLDSMPDEASEATGPELWHIVRPDLELGNRAGPGLSVEQTCVLVDALEAL